MSKLTYSQNMTFIEILISLVNKSDYLFVIFSNIYKQHIFSPAEN